jgi:cell division septum initiation protein DivIVA
MRKSARPAKLNAIRSEIKSTEGKVAEQLALAQRSVEDLWSRSKEKADDIIADAKQQAAGILSDAEGIRSDARAVVANAQAALAGRR